MNSKKKIIVTGGAGFIGSHLVDLLVKKNYEVIIIDNLTTGALKNLKLSIKKIRLVKKDIIHINKNDPIFKNCYAIFHLAGIADIVPSIEDPKKYFKTNFMGTLNILESVRFNKIKKIIYAASSSCYGLAKTPTAEDHKIKCKYPYAMSKYMGEELIKHWSQVYNIKYISIRIFNAFGERCKTKGAYGSVIGVFMRQILGKKRLTVVGNGLQKRDYIYVTDVANAFYLAMKSNKNNQVYNLGSSRPISINQLIKNLNYEKKIKRELNWRPKIRFENGIKIILKNISQWSNAPLWNPKRIKKATALWHNYMK